jgi:hypothetical protein
MTFVKRPDFCDAGGAGFSKCNRMHLRQVKSRAPPVSSVDGRHAVVTVRVLAKTHTRNDAPFARRQKEPDHD